MNVQALREQFPTLRAEEPLTYLDNACVTLRPDSVIQAIREYYTKQPACAGRSPHRWGTAVTQMVSRTRRKVGRFIGADASGGAGVGRWAAGAVFSWVKDACIALVSRYTPP